MAAAQILQERSTGDGRTCDEKCDGKKESGSGIGDRGSGGLARPPRALPALSERSESKRTKRSPPPVPTACRPPSAYDKLRAADPDERPIPSQWECQRQRAVLKHLTGSLAARFVSGRDRHLLAVRRERHPSGCRDGFGDDPLLAGLQIADDDRLRPVHDIHRMIDERLAVARDAGYAVIEGAIPGESHRNEAPADAHPAHLAGGQVADGDVARAPIRGGKSTGSARPRFWAGPRGRCGGGASGVKRTGMPGWWTSGSAGRRPAGSRRARSSVCCGCKDPDAPSLLRSPEPVADRCSVAVRRPKPDRILTNIWHPRDTQSW